MDNQTQCGSRLCAGALGMSLGLLCALMVLVVGLLAHFVHYGEAWINLASSVYVGFAANPKGIAIGVAWAFVDGFVSGALLACLYNAIAKRCKCKCCKPEMNKCCKPDVK